MALAQSPGDRGPLARGRRRLDHRDRHLIGRATGLGGTLPTSGCGADPCRDGGGQRAERRILPVRGAEDHRGRVGAEHLPEAAQRIRLAAAERVRGHIGVAECDDGDAARAERGQEGQRRLGRLLQVVDDDEPQLLDAFSRIPRLDRADREAAQLGGVELVLPEHRHDLQVLVDEVGRRNPRGSASRPAEVAQCIRSHAELGGAGHQLAELCTEPLGAPHVRGQLGRPDRTDAVLDRALEQAGDVGILLTAGDETRGGCSGGPCGGAHDLEGERVHGAGDGAGGGHAEAGRDRVAQSGRRGAGGGEGDQFVRRPAPGLDALGHEFDQGRGLAGAGCAEHGGGHAIRQIDDRLLRRIEPRDRRCSRLLALESDHRHGVNRSRVR